MTITKPAVKHSPKCQQANSFSIQGQCICKSLQDEISPTPWHTKESGIAIYDKNNYFIGDVFSSSKSVDKDKANAAYIVKCVNSHEALVNAVLLALPYVETALEDKGYKQGVVDRMVEKMKAALKLAGE